MRLNKIGRPNEPADVWDAVLAASLLIAMAAIGYLLSLYIPPRPPVPVRVNAIEVVTPRVVPILRIISWPPVNDRDGIVLDMDWRPSTENEPHVWLASSREFSVAWADVPEPRGDYVSGTITREKTRHAPRQHTSGRTSHASQKATAKARRWGNEPGGGPDFARGG